MSKLNFKVITPEKILIDETVDAVYSTAVDGDFGVLRGHVPFMTALDIGISRYKKGNKIEYIATIGGIFKVEDDKIVIMTDAGEKGEEIDIPRARAAKERAEARIGTSSKDIDTERAQIALARAVARIKAASNTPHF